MINFPSLDESDGNIHGAFLDDSHHYDSDLEDSGASTDDRSSGAIVPGIDADTTTTALTSSNVLKTTPIGSLLYGDSEPIAETFPESTVLFADIVGFTAWSAIRDPVEVFTLLENLYGTFDTIAQRRHVFKVETIGDCYVAATGLPYPCKDHALYMARFARECLDELPILLDFLAKVTPWGSELSSLSMRFGLHSGPVTAGNLRGDKSRFQLFGDTVNTAARVESTGQKNKIHISKETAKRLVNCRKSSWVVPHKNMVVAKGKGPMQTFWLQTKQQVPEEEDHHTVAPIPPKSSSRKHHANSESTLPGRGRKAKLHSLSPRRRLSGRSSRWISDKQSRNETTGPAYSSPVRRYKRQLYH